MRLGVQGYPELLHGVGKRPLHALVVDLVLVYQLQIHIVAAVFRVESVKFQIVRQHCDVVESPSDEAEFRRAPLAQLRESLRKRKPLC